MGRGTASIPFIHATKPRGIDITKAQQRPGNVPVVSSGGISSYHDTAYAKAPGVVLGRKGTVGTVFYIPNDYWPHDTSLWVRDFHGNDPRFVYYFFKGMSADLAALDVGTANPALNRNHVHPIIVEWPPLPEQRAIARILSKLDDKIELNRRMNATLESMAQALFKSWFVDFDPVTKNAECGMMNDELFPAEFVETKLGAVPKGWEFRSILNFADLLSGGTPKTAITEYWDGDVPWVSAKDVSGANGLFLLSTERKITELGVQKSNAKILPAKTTIVTARGTVGANCLLGRDMAMNQTNYGLKAKKGFGDYFVFFSLSNLVEQLQQNSYGTIFDTITTRTFQESQTILPPQPLIDHFEKKVTPLMGLILQNIEQSCTLASIRDVLLPRLLSGEVRVR